MLNNFTLLIYYTISGRTGINIASVSWNSTLLISGSLQQNIIDGTIEWIKETESTCSSR